MGVHGRRKWKQWKRIERREREKGGKERERSGELVVEIVFLYGALGNGNVCAFGVSRWRAEMQRHTHQAGPP